MRHLIPWAAALTLLAVACNGSGATATTSMAAITTVTAATTGAAMAAAPTMEGWHLVSAADGQLGRGGGGGLKAVIEGGPGLLAFGEACGLEGLPPGSPSSSKSSRTSARSGAVALWSR